MKSLISRESEIKMIHGEKKSSPSTSVAQPEKAKTLSLYRESRKLLLMHMAHMGMFM